MHKILSEKVPFSGLLTYNDWVAIGAMQTLQSATLETPRDVAVIGFDDRLQARVQDPPSRPFAIQRLTWATSRSWH